MFQELHRMYLVLCLILIILNSSAQQSFSEFENEQYYWYENSQDTLRKYIELKPNLHTAKNLIMFLGDGMSLTTIAASRIYKGQKNKKIQEESLVFENFPHVSLAKTYALDNQVADSANSATAYLCGVKANIETLGVNGKVRAKDCQTSKDTSTHVTSILQWAQEAGKSTGFVTNTRVTHASPAGLYSHVAYRNWESSYEDPECPDIALQLVTKIPGKNIQVILGGGRQTFVNCTGNRTICRTDGRNLIEEWLTDKLDRKLKASYVSNLNEFNKISSRSVDYLLGLFNENHMNYEVDRNNGPEGEPSLEEMTRKAIEILNRNPLGFFLFVEGGRIDGAHHDNKAYKALEETVAMDQAVEAALSLTSQKDTLIVVTADHSHTLTINGYPKRGNNILGLAGVSNIDNLTYTSLSYSNGPGWKPRGENLTEEITSEKNYQQNSAVPLIMETHAGDDVGVFATGPMAHLFQGVHEQSYIPHAMAYAACIGQNLEHCSGKSASMKSTSSISFILMSILFNYFIKKKY